MYSVVYVGKDASLTLRGDHGIRINQSAHTDGQYALYAEAGAQKLSMDAEILEIGGGIKAQSDIAIRIAPAIDPTTRTVFLESGETESFSVRYGLYLDGAARANLKATDTVDGIDGAIMIDEVDVHQRNVRRR